MRDLSGTEASCSNSRNAAEDSSGLSPARFVPAGIAIVAVTYGLARYSYGLFLPDIRAALGLSLPIMGVFAGLSYAGFLIATFLAVRLVPRLGPRRLVVLGGLIAAAGMAIIAIAQGPIMLAFGVFLAGTSPGFAYTPLSEVIMGRIAPKLREKNYAWVNSGTGFGVVVAGPIAIYAGADWRLAWACFAVLAAASAIWIGRVLPADAAATGTGRRIGAAPGWRWMYRRPGAVSLFVSATIFGLVTSVYWTFAVDLLVGPAGVATERAKVFWTIVGVAGIGGCLTGHLVRRIGIRSAWRGFMLALAAAVMGLPLLAALPFGPAASGILFGVAFITVTALYGMWAMNLFADRPSAGFGVVFSLISFGQLIGPVGTGFVAPHVGLVAVFYAAAAATIMMLMATPGRNFSAIS